jgi:serine/threonine protein kinase
LQRVSLADLLRKPAFAAVAAAAVVAAVAIMIFYTWRRRQKSTTTGTLHGAGARTSGTGGADPGKTVLAGEDIPAGFPRELAPRYRNLKLISSGGIARVYSAVRAGDGETVAVKIPLQPDRSTGTSFIKEITARARLSHKNIVRIYDVNILPVPYIEMEYCRSSLADIKKPLPVQDAVGMVREILSGLAYAHGQGTIHRDVKPGNILLCRDNVPKIADWGLSAARDLPNAPTITGFSLSSAAPEQVAPADFGEPDERTDIYGAGIILYELVTGSLPFSDGSVAEMCRQVTQVTPQPPSAYGGHLVLLDPIVMKCLQKHKDDRYQSAGDLDRDLAAITLPREG